MKNNRFRYQSIALVLALAAPFGLYAALQAGLVWLAALCFALIVLALLLTLWKG